MELAEAEARADNDRMVQYAHIRRAIMQTPGLAFLRDLVPEVRIFNQTDLALVVPDTAETQTASEIPKAAQE